MSEAIQLIVGLGNPGPEYAGTRHNAGAMLLAALAQQAHCELHPDRKFHGLYGKTSIAGHATHLLIPTTFMNRSGQSVLAAMQYFKLAPEQILVAHDELDLPCGTVRLKQNGGHGGNNGLRDIIEKLGGRNDFARIRIGIGHPGAAAKVTGHVLSRPTEQEQEQLSDVIGLTLQYLPDIVHGNWSEAMNQLHRFKAE
jgi:PTH1 family peptidyl-tRNA hydrolase